jgi:hypothetical protein
MRGAVALAKPLLEKECNLNVAKANVNLLVVETIVLNMIILMEMLSLFNTSFVLNKKSKSTILL